MPAATYELNLDNTTTSQVIPARLTEGSVSRPPASLEDIRYLPARWLPADQEYYWSETWQADEMTSLREFATGGGETFDSPEELLRWLFSADD